MRRNKGQLHSETLALLSNLPGEDTYLWCKDLQSAKQRLEESKEMQLLQGALSKNRRHAFRSLASYAPGRAIFEGIWEDKEETI